MSIPICNKQLNLWTTQATFSHSWAMDKQTCPVMEIHSWKTPHWCGWCFFFKWWQAKWTEPYVELNCVNFCGVWMSPMVCGMRQKPRTYDVTDQWWDEHPGRGTILMWAIWYGFDLSAIQGFKWGSPKQAKMKPWTWDSVSRGRGTQLPPKVGMSPRVTFYNYGFISTYNWNWSIIASRCR